MDEQTLAQGENGGEERKLEGPVWNPGREEKWDRSEWSWAWRIFICKSYNWLCWLKLNLTFTNISCWRVFKKMCSFFPLISLKKTLLLQGWKQSMTSKAVWKAKRSSCTPTSSSWCSLPTGWMPSLPPEGASGHLTPITASSKPHSLPLENVMHYLDYCSSS